MYKWHQSGEHYTLSQDYELMRELWEKFTEYCVKYNLKFVLPNTAF